MRISKAAILTLLFVGLGQVYNRDYGKAFCIWLADIILFVFYSILGDFVGILVFLIYVYSIYDALKNDKDYHKPKDKKK